MSSKGARKDEDYADHDDPASVRTKLPEAGLKKPRQGFGKPETAFVAQQFERFQAVTSNRKEVCKLVHLEHVKAAPTHGFPARTAESIEGKITRMLEDQDKTLLPSCVFWVNDGGRVVGMKRVEATLGTAGRNARANGAARKHTLASDEESSHSDPESVECRPTKKARVEKVPAVQPIQDLSIELPLPTPVGQMGGDLNQFFAARNVFDANALEAYAIISVPPGFSLDLKKETPNVVATMFDAPLHPSNFGDLPDGFSVLRDALQEGRTMRDVYMASDRTYRHVYEPPQPLKGQKLALEIAYLEALDADGEPRHYAIIKWSVVRSIVVVSVKFK